ncbi:hypothetical protein FRACA_20025 [Frankia canadensis]|uniref:Uncharacterized protein n=1 Tax=Frankia canadensis TaxID=1836972 RepID=A0A2I2KPP3_9ACTN|nr:hypothetical protein FRACA_20025 [Frankia canadensis]SOU54919.1 hypothetical protein FRACA_20025 [Frankia canadensis]
MATDTGRPARICWTWPATGPVRGRSSPRRPRRRRAPRSATTWNVRRPALGDWYAATSARRPTNRLEPVGAEAHATEPARPTRAWRAREPDGNIWRLASHGRSRDDRTVVASSERGGAAYRWATDQPFTV